MMSRTMRVPRRGGWGIATAAVAGLITLAGDASAVETKTWRTAGREGFLGATLESLSVSSEGIVRPAPALVPIAGIEVAYVWSLAATPSGEVWAGTGNSGAIYRVEATRGLKVKTNVKAGMLALI